MKKIIFLCLISVFVLACRTDENIVPSTSTTVTSPYSGDVQGMYLLNEGNMGSNKATLDYFDISKGTYEKNIYGERNPNVVSELGDVGNDLQAYGDRLYAVINCSNLVEVMNLDDATHIAAISIPNCRYITFSGNYAYVSSYAGQVEIDPNSRVGYISKIDLNTLEEVAQCEVGYQPEQMAVLGDKLYVANSGGYKVPDYDNRVMVIDLDSFEVIKEIEVAINLHGLALDSQNMLWVSSRGDYYDTPSQTFVIDTSTDEVVAQLDLANSAMTIDDDYLYVLSSDFSYSSMNQEVGFAKVYTPTQTIQTQNIITDGTESAFTAAYGLDVNPETKEIYITDAKDYVTPGKLYCYTPGGILSWSVTTGDIPSKMVFVEK